MADPPERRRRMVEALATIPVTEDVATDANTTVYEAGECWVVLAPVNVTAPYVAQDYDQLTCTMGTWEGEPTSYRYQWRSDGITDIGTGATYVVTSADIGHVVTCIVTAINAGGATEGPPSNGVLVTTPAIRRTRR